MDPEKFKTGLVLMDFDGTLTKKDSFVEFMKFTHGRMRFYRGYLSLLPFWLQYEAGIMPNWRAKEMALEHFYQDYDCERFTELAHRFSLEQLPLLIKHDASDRIAWHKGFGHRIIVVSASIDLWLIKWCEKNELELIATQLEVIDGKITGKLKGKNCYGPEKVRRVKELVDLSDYELTFAYGDGRGDLEMLQLATRSYYKPFKK